jgi:outer membrane protein assembly factor BamB
MLAHSNNPESPMLAAGRVANWFRRSIVGFTIIAIFSFASSIARAEESNWPEWRGPSMTGVSQTADPPLTWSETKNIKWKTKIPGRGLATPLVWGEQVFIQTAIPVAEADHPSDPKTGPSNAAHDNPNKSESSGGKSDEPAPRHRGHAIPRPTEAYQFVLICVDRRTGKTLWQKVARKEVPHEGKQLDNSFASNSPVTDGKRVVAYFGSRGLHCYDMRGNLKWEKDLGQMKTKNSFGEGSSPALFGNTVVVNWDHEGPSFIVASDVDSGKELWRTPRKELTSWATPIIIEQDGKAQVITAGNRKVRSYDLASGKLLWECDGLTNNAIPTPVFGDGMVYATTGFRQHMMLAIRPDHAGDVTGTDAVAWTLNKGTPFVPSPLLYGDRLYFFSGNAAILSCIDSKSGHPIYDDQRVEDLVGIYSSPVGAAGRIYLVGRNGVTVVIKHADKFEILASNRLDDEFDASPALAGKELFLRGHEYLYCIADHGEAANK